MTAAAAATATIGPVAASAATMSGTADPAITVVYNLPVAYNYGITYNAALIPGVATMTAA